MRQEDVIRMARKAGYDLDRDETCREVSTSEIFMAFARLVAAHEREACIRACDAVDLIGADDCIEAIRARSNP